MRRRVALPNQPLAPQARVADSSLLSTDRQISLAHLLQVRADLLANRQLVQTLCASNCPPNECGQMASLPDASCCHRQIRAQVGADLSDWPTEFYNLPAGDTD